MPSYAPSWFTLPHFIFELFNDEHYLRHHWKASLERISSKQIIKKLWCFSRILFEKSPEPSLLWIFFEFPDVLFKTGAQPCRLPTMSIYCFSLTSASFSSTQETVMALKCHFCKYLPTSCRSLLLRCACCNKEVK